MARILILVENLSVPFDRRVWQASRALVEAGREVDVICPRGTKRDTEPSARIDGIGSTATPQGRLGRPRATCASTAGARHSLRLARQLTRGPVDVVHCDPPDLLFLVACW